MKNQVTIVADDNGNVINQSKNNAEWGYIKLTQGGLVLGQKFINAKKKYAILSGLLTDLKELELEDLKTLPGNIVIKESTEPFNAENPDSDLKIAGSTGIICCTADGEPIYRTTFYDATGEIADELKPHSNGDAIREANKSGASKIADSAFNLEKKSKKVETQEVKPEYTSEDVIEDSMEEVEIEDSKEDSFEL